MMRSFVTCHGGLFVFFAVYTLVAAASFADLKGVGICRLEGIAFAADPDFNMPEPQEAGVSGADVHSERFSGPTTRQQVIFGRFPIFNLEKDSTPIIDMKLTK